MYPGSTFHIINLVLSLSLLCLAAPGLRKTTIEKGIWVKLNPRMYDWHISCLRPPIHCSNYIYSPEISLKAIDLRLKWLLIFFFMTTSNWDIICLIDILMALVGREWRTSVSRGVPQVLLVDLLPCIHQDWSQVKVFFSSISQSLSLRAVHIIKQ